MSVKTLHFSQIIPTTLNQAWEFFSNPNNLRNITPEKLDFNIISNPPSDMYEGLFIHYTVRPLLGFPILWVSEITHINAPHYFIDEQRYGPYRIWHHEHRFLEVDGGVKMDDTITFQVGYGPLDAAINPLIVIPQIKKIFEFRRKVIDQIFS